MRIMALDVGEKKIGVAISDPFGWTSATSFVISRTSDRKVFKELEKYIQEKDIDQIVVGLPVNMDGSDSTQTEKVKKFKDKICKNLNINVIMWDERLSTVSAERSLIEADLSRKQRKKVIDGVAATFILQSYLAYKKNSNNE